MKDDDDISRPRPPRAEPEVIPPGAAHRRSDEQIVFVEMRDGRLHFFRPSLGTFLLAAAIVGLVAAVLLVLLLGAVLLSLPVLGVVFLLLLIGSVMRARAPRRR